MGKSPPTTDVAFRYPFFCVRKSLFSAGPAGAPLRSFLLLRIITAPPCARRCPTRAAAYRRGRGSCGGAGPAVVGCGETCTRMPHDGSGSSATGGDAVSCASSYLSFPNALPPLRGMPHAFRRRLALEAVAGTTFCPTGVFDALGSGSGDRGAVGPRTTAPFLPACPALTEGGAGMACGGRPLLRHQCGGTSSTSRNGTRRALFGSS